MWYRFYRSNQLQCARACVERLVPVSDPVATEFPHLLTQYLVERYSVTNLPEQHCETTDSAMTSLPGQNISTSAGTSEETAWTRLSTAFKYATSRVQMDKEVTCLLTAEKHTVHNPPISVLFSDICARLQVPDPPPELKEWSQNTSLGVFAGLMFGGGTQWLRDRQAGTQHTRAGSA